jgi:hypothetical protein
MNLWCVDQPVQEASGRKYRQFRLVRQLNPSAVREQIIDREGENNDNKKKTTLAEKKESKNVLVIIIPRSRTFFSGRFLLKEAEKPKL